MARIGKGRKPQGRMREGEPGLGPASQVSQTARPDHWGHLQTALASQGEAGAQLYGPPLGRRAAWGLVYHPLSHINSDPERKMQGLGATSSLTPHFSNSPPLSQAALIPPWLPHSFPGHYHTSLMGGLGSPNSPDLPSGSWSLSCCLFPPRADPHPLSLQLWVCCRGGGFSTNPSLLPPALPSPNPEPVECRLWAGSRGGDGVAAGPQTSPAPRQEKEQTEQHVSRESQPTPGRSVRT